MCIYIFKNMYAYIAKLVMYDALLIHVDRDTYARKLVSVCACKICIYSAVALVMYDAYTCRYTCRDTCVLTCMSALCVQTSVNTPLYHEVAAKY